MVTYVSKHKVVRKSGITCDVRRTHTVRCTLLGVHLCNSLRGALHIHCVHFSISLSPVHDVTPSHFFCGILRMGWNTCVVAIYIDRFASHNVRKSTRASRAISTMRIHTYIWCVVGRNHIHGGNRAFSARHAARSENELAS